MAPAINEDTVANIKSKLVVVGGKSRQEYWTDHIKASISLPGMKGLHSIYSGFVSVTEEQTLKL